MSDKKRCAVCGAVLVWSQRKYCSEECYLKVKKEYMREYQKNYYKTHERKKKRTEHMHKYRREKNESDSLKIP